MASSGPWYSLTELCCDTWRQQKNSLEKKKKTSLNISYQVGKSVCVCRAGVKMDLHLQVPKGCCTAGIPGAPAGPAGAQGKSQQAAGDLWWTPGVAASQTLPRCSHNKELSRTIPEIPDPAEDEAVQLLYWLRGQQTSPSSGLQMFGKEDAGWVNFYFVWDFCGTDIYIPSFFPGACSVTAALPLFHLLEFFNTVTSLAPRVAKGAGGWIFLLFPIELQPRMLNIMCKSQITAQNSQ